MVITILVVVVTLVEIRVTVALTQVVVNKRHVLGVMVKVIAAIGVLPLLICTIAKGQVFANGVTVQDGVIQVFHALIAQHQALTAIPAMANVVIVVVQESVVSAVVQDIYNTKVQLGAVPNCTFFKGHPLP